MRSFLCFLLLLGGDDFAAGVRAFRAGRFADALAAFAAAEAAAGSEASAALLYNKALAALRAGSWSDAEAAIEQAATRSGAEFAPLRDFVRGNVAFARGEAAAKQAGSVESEPFAFDAAIALAESALDAWQDAVMRRADWPQARRNAERAARLLADLQQKKAAAAAKKNQAKKEPDAPAPKPEPPEQDDQKNKPPPDELSPEQVRRLLEKLAVKEMEKVRLRRSQQQAVGVPPRARRVVRRPPRLSRSRDEHLAERSRQHVEHAPAREVDQR